MHRITVSKEFLLIDTNNISKNAAISRARQALIGWNISYQPSANLGHDGCCGVVPDGRQRPGSWRWLFAGFRGIEWTVFSLFGFCVHSTTIPARSYIIAVQLEVLIQLLLIETLFDFVGLHRPLANTTRFLNLILNWAPNPRISARLSSMRFRDWRGPAVKLMEKS